MIFKLIDNFLPFKYFEKISEEVNSVYFPWYYNRDITDGNTHKINDIKFLDSHGFNHDIFMNNQISSIKLYHILTGFYGALLQETGKDQILNSRLDMTIRTSTLYKHHPHVDVNCDNITTIFYLTDSDGETEIYDQVDQNYSNSKMIDYATLTVFKSIVPKQNRLIIFDGKHLHTGHSPTKFKNRILLNTVLI